MSKKILKTQARSIAARWIASTCISIDHYSFENSGLTEDEINIIIDAVKDRCEAINDTDITFGSMTEIIKSVLHEQ